MVGLKEWYKEEISSVGHLAAMEDEYLQRMYASKVVSGMNHLVKALEERMEDASNADKKKEFELMMHSVKTAMAHVKADYDVSEDNITYKWNMNKNKNNNNNQTPSVASEPALLAPSTNENNEANNEANNETNNNSLPQEAENNNSLPGERVNLNQLVENNKNLAESNVLTLNELSEYIKGKTAKPSRNNGESKEMNGGRRTRRKGKKSKKTRRH